MNFEQRLAQVADRYHAQGYEVVVRPGPDELPEFAKDFKVEILARRGDGCVLASAKETREEFEDDRELPRYAEVLDGQPGWRFDVFVLGPDRQPIPERGEAKEPSEEDIRRALGDVEGMLQAGFVQQALIAAWAVLETAMRRRLHADGRKTGRGSSLRSMMNELYSDGVLSTHEFRELERLFQAWNAIVHGFKAPVVETGSVKFLVDAAKTLLDEALAARPDAKLSMVGE